jgi:membrane-bound lytic murein transglycosylase F
VADAVAGAAARAEDLPQVRARGVLRVLVEDTEEHGLPRQGTARAQDRALLAEFAQRQGLRAEFVAAGDLPGLFRLLEEGRGDVLADGLTITPERRTRVAFTLPVAVTREWLVGRKGARGLPRTPEQLAGRQVHVRASSAFADTLRALAAGRAPGLAVVAVEERVTPEEIAYQVSRGKRPLTVVDETLLKSMEAYNPDVQRLFPLAEGRQLAWAVRPGSTELRAALDAFITEKALLQYAEEAFTGDLEGVKKRGVLRVLTRNNPVTYFLHRGEQAGFDYELAQLAAEALGVRLEVVVPPSRDLLIPWLLEGRGDVIAASLTVTPERRRQVAFSRPYLEVRELLVAGKGARPLASLAELKGATVHVRRSSSYFQTLQALQGTHGPFTVVEEPEEQETETLLQRAAAGELPYTVADSHLVDVERAHGAGLGGGGVEGGLPLGAPQGIAFAVRPGSRKLLQALDALLAREVRGLRYNMARRRYFENAQRIQEVREEQATRTGVLSPYDGLLKKYGSRYGMDWRLMAAQAFQESRFKPEAKSWVGATGLFQVMPATGRSLGFSRLEDPEEGTHAGILYMSQLLRQLPPHIPLKQRLRFALAGYNAGMGHVHDARRLAAERGWDPDRWFGHVEKAMLLLQRPEYYRRARHGYCRGSEPVAYVSRIQLRYQGYVGAVSP